jgi:HSP20 family protein
MNRLQRDMNRLFGNMTVNRERVTQSFPAINIWAGENSAVITAEIPGVNQNELDLSVTGDTLSIAGERKHEELPEGAKYHRNERSFGKFNRNIQLPYTVDVDKVKASFKNGVLEIELPRVEAEKPKKITVKAS